VLLYMCVEQRRRCCCCRGPHAAAGAVHVAVSGGGAAERCGAVSGGVRRLQRSSRLAANMGFYIADIECAEAGWRRFDAALRPKQT